MDATERAHSDLSSSLGEREHPQRRFGDRRFFLSRAGVTTICTVAGKNRIPRGSIEVIPLFKWLEEAHPHALRNDATFQN